MSNLTEVKLYKGEVSIFIPPSGHPYFHADGSKILSVSEVIGLMDKPALKWYASGCAAEHIFDFWDIRKVYTPIEKLELVKEGYYKFNERAKVRAKAGTEVHDFAESFVKGKKPEIPTDPDVQNGVIGFMRWWKDTNLLPVKTEKVVYSKKYDVAGRSDLTAKTKGKRVTYHIVDYKAVSMYKKVKSFEIAEYSCDPESWENNRYKTYIPSDDGFALSKETGEKIKYPIFDEPRLQVSAYRGFSIEETGKNFGESYIVRFDKEFGDFDVTVLSVEEQEAAYEAFCHFVGGKRYLMKYGVKI